MPIIFHGDAHTAYRDPTCFVYKGVYQLFFTVSQKENGYMYNFVGQSTSTDLRHWSPVRLLTPKDKLKNFGSPGNILPVGEEYLLCMNSYPLPRLCLEQSWGDENSRLFLMRTKDFCTFTPPEPIYAKGTALAGREGRMIDAFLLRDKDDPQRILLFYKQNGVSVSESYDLREWKYVGHADAGENACVLVENNRYVLLHSPQNGIGVKASDDLLHWEDKGTFTLQQEQWPWASGRLTAAFALPTPDRAHRYLVFFHGSRTESLPETHGAASLAYAWTDDFTEFFWEDEK